MIGEFREELTGMEWNGVEWVNTCKANYVSQREGNHTIQRQWKKLQFKIKLEKSRVRVSVRAHGHFVRAAPAYIELLAAISTGF